jgi:hypothetical protein
MSGETKVAAQKENPAVACRVSNFKPARAD